MMAHHGRSFSRVLCPVAAGHIREPLRARKGGSVRTGSGQDVVCVGLLGPTIDDSASLVERGLLVDVVVCRMQVVDVLRNHYAFGVVPWACANAVTGVIVEHTGWTIFFCLCTALAVPGMLLLLKVAPWNEARS